MSLTSLFLLRALLWWSLWLRDKLVVVLITELTNIWRLKQLITYCANSSRLMLRLLILVVVLRLHNLWVVGRILFLLIYGLFNAWFCSLWMLTVWWRHLTISLLLLVTFYCAAIVTDLLVARLKLLFNGFLLFLAFRLGSINFDFNIVLIEIGSIMLNLSLDSALNIFQVIWLHRRCDWAFSIKSWLLSHWRTFRHMARINYLFYGWMLYKHVAAFLHTIVSNTFILFVYSARWILVEQLWRYLMLSRNSKALALIIPVVSNIYDVVRNASFCFCSVLVLHLVRKFSVKSLSCSFSLL